MEENKSEFRVLKTYSFAKSVLLGEGIFPIMEGNRTWQLCSYTYLA
ncbi:MAG: hypothetical protein AB2375_02360 [Tissierellaceae bacterium]